MSGQAKRSRVLAAQRHREQVARAVVEAGAYYAHPTSGEWSHRKPVVVARLLGGNKFDVAKAREYAERLIAEGEFWRIRDPHTAVDDWRRGQGREPERRLDRETGRVVWCEPPGLPPGVPGSALSWQASARLGHRLLAALEGQPSECQGCAIEGPEPWCPECHGTGHNLHGVLPKFVIGPHSRRKAVEAMATGGRGELEMWRFGERVMFVPTRVVPRGEHRDESRIGLRGWAPSSCVRIPHHTRMPRWRRGELKHAEQRRERAHIPCRRCGGGAGTLTRECPACDGSGIDSSRSGP